MKKTFLAKAGVGFVTLATALTLVACSDSNDDESSLSAGENNSSTVSGSNDKDSRSAVEAEEAKKNGEQVKSGDAKVDDITEVAAAFYNEIFTVALDGGIDTIIKAQDEMTEAVDGDVNVFAAADPRDSIAELSPEMQKNLVTVTERYSGDISKFSNYADLNDSEKVALNMVALIFKSSLASGQDGLTVTIDPEKVSVDGSKAVIDTSGIIFNMKDDNGLNVNEASVITVNTELVKSRDGWKIDARSFLDSILSEDMNTVPAE